ncbi:MULTISPECIES: thioredoxin family protein [unclassified Polaribacter]|uniref:thioredoxin family protein n=1 Tax=unclassified Polaribacter TaxID=196858 RepID=UPI0011BEDF22|nr:MULTISPECIES: thioredoxin domain-containing protein [unclassified Polaribacter]TXD54470.1 DUF953 domain-containing protein [Polaribacter sp. IC063]TXD60383.1 DUF953 domain-containing protein [Polaribacter sp. IC066]
MNRVSFFFIASFIAFQTTYGQEVSSISTEDVKVNEIELQWISTFKEALAKSKKENKPVLMYFTGSDWCGPCKVLDKKLFHTEKFKNLSDQDLVLLEVDIPRRRDLIHPTKMEENLYLQKKYKVKAFPTLLMVDHRGKKLAEKKGYVMTAYYYPFFQSVISSY